MEGNGGWFAIVIVALILGLVGGFFGARWLIKREMKKNPPINEAQIRAMFRGTGAKPSEAKIRSIMNEINKNSTL